MPLMIVGQDNHPQSGAPGLPREGECVAGKYEIKKRIGAGGMGVVLAAHHKQLDQPVAIKFLRPEEATKSDSTRRFLREARAAVRIQCEHGVRVMDVGTLDSGIPFMVMELLRGRDLGELLCVGGPLAIGDAVEYILQASEAVSEAHMRGIVHRDLKPSNLFVSHRPDGSVLVKVLDFGISKAHGLLDCESQNAQQTGSHLLLGSPYYMAPEQLDDASSVDARADIWALGAILYEALTGTQPFKGTTLPALCAQILCATPTPPRDLRADIPIGLESAIIKCLRGDRSQRYRSIGEMASALLEYGPPQSKASVDRILGIERGRIPGVSLHSGREERVPEPGETTWIGTFYGNRNRLTTGVTAAIALTFLGGLGALLASTRSGQAPAREYVAEPKASSCSSTEGTSDVPPPRVIVPTASTPSPIPLVSGSSGSSLDQPKRSARMHQPQQSADAAPRLEGKPGTQPLVDPLGDRK